MQILLILGVRVAKALSFDTVNFFFFNREPPSCGVEKRRDQRNCAIARISLIPPLLNTTTQGGGGSR